MSKTIAVSGSSQTGKTRLIERLAPELKRRGWSVAVVKHCPHGFIFDVEGKDSRRFYEAGADGVGMLSPDQLAVVRRLPGEQSLRFLIRTYFPHIDYIFIEGGKNIKGFRTIEILARGVHEVPSSAAGELAAVVSDFAVKSDKPVFNPDQIAIIADFLENGIPDDSESTVRDEANFFSRRDPAVLDVLRASTIGIAGAGGLGSNVAVSLARVGVGTLIIADFDLIETSNLNRQQYFLNQVGRPKVEALKENLAKINPYSKYMIHHLRITPGNVADIFGTADLLVEAFDLAGQKHKLMESWLSVFPDRPIILASGLAGFGRNESLHTRRMGNLFIVGDEAGECPEGISPMAPRVAIVANMQANLAVELLIERSGKYPD